MLLTILNRVYKKASKLLHKKRWWAIRKVLNKFEEISEQPELKSCLWLVAFLIRRSDVWNVSHLSSKR